MKLSEHEALQNTMDVNLKLKDEVIETLAKENEKLKANLQALLRAGPKKDASDEVHNTNGTQFTPIDTEVAISGTPLETTCGVPAFDNDEGSDEGWQLLGDHKDSTDTAKQKEHKHQPQQMGSPEKHIQALQQQQKTLLQKKQGYLRKIQTLREQVASLQQDKASIQKELSNTSEFKQHLATQLLVMTEEKDRIQEKVWNYLMLVLIWMQMNSMKKEISSLGQRHENDKRVIIKQRAKLKGPFSPVLYELTASRTRRSKRRECYTYTKC